MKRLFNIVGRYVNLILNSLFNAKKDQLTIDNFIGFIQGTSRKFLEDIGFDSLNWYVKEQIIWRSISCSQCTIEGKCVKCKCHTPEKYYDDRGCESGNYPKMLNEQDWIEYKLINNINKEMLEKTVVKVENNIFNFGEIAHKDVVMYNFVLKNVGLNPMKIDRVSTSCGCTASDWSNEIIGIDEETTVTAKFDSTDKLGNFIKTITVKGNFDDIQLKIKGNVYDTKQHTQAESTQEQEVPEQRPETDK